MTSHEEVAEAWGMGDKATGSRMYTDGTTIFSYGSHFPIAIKIGFRKILFNTDRYSNSTTHHQNYVKREALDRDWKIIECTTSEIQQATEASHPVVITRTEPIKDIDEVFDALKRLIKEKYNITRPMYLNQLRKDLDKWLIVKRISQEATNESG